MILTTNILVTRNFSRHFYLLALTKNDITLRESTSVAIVSVNPILSSFYLDYPLTPVTSVNICVQKNLFCQLKFPSNEKQQKKRKVFCLIF